MLKKVVATLLSKYLGRYVEGLEEENLALSVKDGNLVLNDLRLRAEVLDDLELPVTMHSGWVTLSYIRT